MAKLKNPKHEAVLQAFVADKNRVGWKAYAAVYAKSSQRAAETAWSRMLKDAEFAGRRDELLAELTDKVIENTGITVERVLGELAKLGFANMQDYVEVFPEGNVEAVTRDQAAAIQELVVDTYMDGAGDDAREVKRVRFKLYDKRAALIEIGRQLGMFKNVHEHTGKDGKPIETKDTTDYSDLEIGRRILFALEKAARAQKAAKATKKG